MTGQCRDLRWPGAWATAQRGSPADTAYFARTANAVPGRGAVSERVAARLLRLLLGFLAAGLVAAGSAQAAGQFTSIQAPFTQSLYGTASGFFGGVAFAPNSDPLVDFCQGSGSSLDRFDSSQTSPLTNGTSTLHPVTTESSAAGCGLTNHPNGSLYSNTGAGVVKLDASTGASAAGPFGPSGNALGIAVDPQTQNLVYVGSDGTIRFVDAGFTSIGTFSTAVTGDFIDQIAFDPTGNFLFLSDRTRNALLVLRHDGSLVQAIPLAGGRGEPDGIAFHTASPQFVVTNDTDGTISRFDFPNNDFTATPTQSAFASGGFRGDNSAVGSDGCLYLTQDGTRYDDGTTNGNDSLVQICPGFAPPPGVGNRSVPDRRAVGLGISPVRELSGNVCREGHLAFPVRDLDMRRARYEQRQPRRPLDG